MTLFEAKENMGLSKMALDVADHFNVSMPKDDEDFHDWAESRGLDVHEAEQGAYELAAILVKFLYGGRANEKGITVADVDSDELAMGIKVEMEHTSDPETARRIATDHLAELDDYYTRLKKMEAEAGIKE